MAKISLSYDAFNVNGLNALDSAINYCDSVINYLQQNSIPSDFSHYNVLINTIADLKKQRSNLAYVKKWIVNSNKDYDVLISKLELHAASLPAGRMKKRSSIVH